MAILKKIADRYYNPKKSTGVTKRGTSYRTVIEIKYKKGKRGYFTRFWDVPYGRKYFKTLEGLKKYSESKTNLPIKYKKI